MQPHHTHDCGRCRLLGAVAGPKGPVDLYRCEAKAGPEGQTFVARFSSDGPDYSSGGRKFLQGLEGSGFMPGWSYCRIGMAMDDLMNA